MHEQAVGTKALRTAQTLSRIIVNIGGLSTAKRKLMASVIHSQLLYVASVWAPILDYRAGSKKTKCVNEKRQQAEERLLILIN